MSNERKHWSEQLQKWNGNVELTFDHLQLAALMSIRKELQRLNNVMQCSNVARGFRAMAKIAARDERAFKRRVANAVRKREKRRGRK